MRANLLRRCGQFLLTIFVALLLGGRTHADARLSSEEEQAFRQAGQKVLPSIVRVQTVGGAERVSGMLTGTAATTGVIVDPSGGIISSAFNFISKPSSILVQLADGRRLPARLVATDRLRMLTLLKVEATGLPAVNDSAGADSGSHAVRPGQWAIALGRTYEGDQPSLSVGIVSAVNRVWGRAIQTDAKVSPVNYGGPLVDVRGNVLGIIVPLSPTGKEEAAGVEWYDSGIGFAIPLADAILSARRLASGKDLHPGLLGVTLEAEGIDGRPTIETVRYDSPAEKAGLKNGDAILSIDGRQVGRSDEIKLALGRKYAGDKAKLVVRRGDKQVEAEPELVDVLRPFDAGSLGILHDRGAAAGGVRVRFVFKDSPAAKAGVAAGDVIRQAGGATIENREGLTSIARKTRPGTKLPLVIVRGSAEMKLEVVAGPVGEDIPVALPPSTWPAAAKAAEPPKDAKDKNAAKPAPPKTGRVQERLPGEGAPAYWAYLPESFSADGSWGLMLLFGPPEESAEVALIARWKAACAERRILIVAPAPQFKLGFNPNDLEPVRRVLDFAAEKYQIDPARVWVHGVGRNAAFASLAAFRNVERVRGLALVAGMIATAPPETRPDQPFKMYLWASAQDRNAERVRKAAEIIREGKIPATLRTPDEPAAEYLPPTDTDELARWADCLDRI